jgi:uncharacterized membrane protein
MYELQYVPLALPFFLFLVGLFLLIVVLIQIRVLQYAYAKLGLSSGAALLLLLASLIGSYFNIPLAELPEREVRSGQVVEFFGMRYVVPVVADWPRTVIAVNVGGALIPSLLSFYLLLKNRIWSSAAVATLVVAVACYLLAQPVPGIGIAIPSLIPPIIAATIALLVARTNVAAVAYISGSLGTLIGAICSISAKFRGSELQSLDWRSRHFRRRLSDRDNCGALGQLLPESLTLRVSVTP